MHFLKAAFITAGFFAGFVIGKDICLAVLARAAAPAPSATQAAA